MLTTPWSPPHLAATEKVTPAHQARRAYVYVRQSSPKQVQHNRESQANQYALVQRAQALGWIPERIHVIDADLGESGQDPERAGFRDLVAEVSLGRVGLVLAYEASRLARNNAAWYELLDLATLVGTLIADADGVYDPRQYNDRLLLGLRGMLSEAELHLLRLRLDAGRLRQVERGAFRQHLPTGYVRRPDGQVVLDPDQQIQHVIRLVFTRYANLGSVHRVLRSLHADQVRLPQRQTSGPRVGEVVWQTPSARAVRRMLHNPAYAGAFAYGRRQVVARAGSAGGRTVARPPDAWLALVPDRYPAYIPWETFMRNQDRLANNRSQFAQRAQGAPRRGTALLAGLAVCGRCGRQLYVRYKPAPQYACVGRRESHALPACLYVHGSVLEPPVVAAFFAALRPAELDVLEDALAALAADQQARLQQYADALARATYEARLAERHYRAVDPDNRLVAAELERRWEVALRAEAEAREAADRAHAAAGPPTLDPALAAQVRQLSATLPDLWHGGQIAPEDQKAFLRALIRRVVVTRPQPARIAVTIVWVSGAVNRLEAPTAVCRSLDLPDYPAIVARVRVLAAEGLPDRAIAQQLAAEEFASVRGVALPVRLVQAIRAEEHLASVWQQTRGQPRVDGHWTVPGLARALGVSRFWLYREIAAGRITATRHQATGRYLVANTPTLLDDIRALPTVPSPLGGHSDA